MRKLGFSVQIVSQIPGALDLIVGYMGTDQRIEIKDPEQPASKRRLTEAEQETFDEWRGRRPVVIETLGDVLKLQRELSKEVRF